MPIDENDAPKGFLAKPCTHDLLPNTCEGCWFLANDPNIKAIGSCKDRNCHMLERADNTHVIFVKA